MKPRPYNRMGATPLPSNRKTPGGVEGTPVPDAVRQALDRVNRMTPEQKRKLLRGGFGKRPTD